MLEGRTDHEYGVPARLSYLRCGNEACELVFAREIPAPAEIQSFYVRYSSHHQAGASGSWLARYGGATRDRELRRAFGDRDLSTIKVLGLGCGSGCFLLHLQSLSVVNAFGYDFDPEACKCTERAGATAFSASEQLEAAGPYDFIFLNHVIEHLSDPAEELGWLRQHLAPGGRLVVRTPNASSVLAKLFGADWRGWETPRHLHVFNQKNIASRLDGMPAEGKVLAVREKSASNAMFAGMYHESFLSPFWRQGIAGKVLRHLFCVPLFFASQALNSLSGTCGEEVVLVLEASE